MHCRIGQEVQEEIEQERTSKEVATDRDHRQRAEILWTGGERIEYLHTQLGHRDARILTLGSVAIFPNSFIELRAGDNDLTDRNTRLRLDRLDYRVDARI
jgi:hypothetical protein